MPSIFSVSEGSRNNVHRKRLTKDAVTQTLPEEKIELPDRTAIVKYVPVGVVVAICPWNCKYSFGCMFNTHNTELSGIQ
jgi:acyl-CoA reductase-like NAD-dependent aldehyde dehydrogenase